MLDVCKNMSYAPEEKKLLESFYKNKNDIRFIKIGAHRGVTCPLYEIIKNNKTWTGVFFEPHPILFEELKDNYDNEFRFSFENYAVSDQQGLSHLYTLNKKIGQIDGNDKKACEYTELNSFYMSVIMKLHDYFNYSEKDLDIIPVKTIGINHVFKKYNTPTDLDLLYIDTEGHDLVILNQIDLNIYKIKVLVYEFDNSNSILIGEFRKKLKLIGYKIYSFWSDDVCILE